MKVDYINSDIRDDFVRVTFVGFDTKGRRRPVVDLDYNDLVTLLHNAREFRARQRANARRLAARADAITQTGLSE